MTTIDLSQIFPVKSSELETYLSVRSEDEKKNVEN